MLLNSSIFPDFLSFFELKIFFSTFLNFYPVATCQMARLRFFPYFLCRRVFGTHVSRVAPNSRDLLKDALPTELRGRGGLKT